MLVNGISVRQTRYTELGYSQFGPGLWRFITLQDGGCSPVGPHYRTKAELLSDLDRYATEVWGY
jgi:hypothetical protein